MIGGWPRTRWLSPTQMRVPPVPRSWGPVMTIRRWEPGDRRDVPQNLSEKPLRFKNEARPAVPPGPALRGALLFEEPEAALLPLPVHGQTPRSPAGARCGGRPRSHEESYQAEGAPGPSAGGPGLTRNLIKLRVPPVPRFWGPGRKSHLLREPIRERSVLIVAGGPGLMPRMIKPGVPPVPRFWGPGIAQSPPGQELLPKNAAGSWNWVAPCWSAIRPSPNAVCRVSFPLSLRFSYELAATIRVLCSAP